MRYIQWIIAVVCMLLLLAACQITVPGDLFEVDVKVLPSQQENEITLTPTAVPGEGGDKPTQFPQIYVALTAITPTVGISDTRRDTNYEISYQAPIDQMPLPLTGFGEFVPTGEVKLAVARPISLTALPLGLTPATQGEWIIFVADDAPDADWLMWEQLVFTPTTSSTSTDLLPFPPLMRESVQRPVDKENIIRFDRTNKAPNNWPEEVQKFSEDWVFTHPGQRLWFDLLLVEEKVNARGSTWVLYRFMNDGRPPDETQGKAYHCTQNLGCNHACSVSEKASCWWNGCSAVCQ